MEEDELEFEIPGLDPKELKRARKAAQKDIRDDEISDKAFASRKVTRKASRSNLNNEDVA